MRPCSDKSGVTLRPCSGAACFLLPAPAEAHRHPAPPSFHPITPFLGSPQFSDPSSPFLWGCGLFSLQPCLDSAVQLLQGSAPTPVHHHPSAGQTGWLSTHKHRITYASLYREYTLGYTNLLTWSSPGCVLTETIHLRFPRLSPETLNGAPPPPLCVVASRLISFITG